MLPVEVTVSPALLAACDLLLTLLHVAVVAGFVLLWIFPSTIRHHRWLVIATALSWLVLGYFKGLGYCVLTDWHWTVKRARGATDLPGSFIKYAADALTGTDLPRAAVDTVAGATFVLGVGAAVWRYAQERQRRERDGRGVDP